MAFSPRLFNAAKVGTYGLIVSKLLYGMETSSQKVEESKTLYNDYFNDEKLSLAVAGRSAAEFELKMFMKKASNDHRKLVESLQRSRDHQTRAISLSLYNDFNHKLKLNAERMMYPGQNIGLRQNYLNHFGCTAWTEAALSKIKEYSYYGVVELGAGSGKWANALRLRGCDVKAFDNMSFLPESKETQTPSGDISAVQSETISLAKKAGVEIGDEKVFQDAAHNSSTYLGLKGSNNLSNRSLMLVYPPSGDMAVKVLRQYEGKTLIYIGEGRGGVNANDDLFHVLENRIKFKIRKGEKDRGEWTLVHTESLAPFPGGYEKMYVFKRKG